MLLGVGHLAASFAVRARFPRVPLLCLLAAGGFLDLVWGCAVITGIERAHVGTETGSAVPIVLDSVPYSHSLIASLVWGSLVSLAWWRWGGDGAGAVVLGALVASHWVLDVVSHVPDIPVLASGPLVGLGLWRSRIGSLIVELGMLWAGLAMYARGTTGKDRLGRGGLGAVAALLTIAGVLAYLGSPPGSAQQIAVGNLVVFLPLLLIEWIDRHRQSAAMAG
jgi:hypothetical protein